MPLENKSPNPRPSRERERADPGHAPMRAVPLAYFITFSCYGTWLHGSNPLSVDRNHNRPGGPFVIPDPPRQAAARRRLDQPPYKMDARRREIVLSAIREVAVHRRWNLLAAQVRSVHVHIVVQSAEAPERVMNDFKAYGSRKLNEAKLYNPGKRRWTRHGSTRYLWNPEEVEAAIQYVVSAQGEPMAVFDIRDETWSKPYNHLSDPRA